MHQVYLLIGSNIQPQQNIQAALKMLDGSCVIKRCSKIWKTTPYGSAGPDFLNIVALVDTPMEKDQVKTQLITSIEMKLKRKRTSDKNAPRTIDVDIIIFDGEVLDQGLWNKFFITVPMADLLPELKDPDSGKPLHEIAQGMLDQGLAVFYSDCF